MLSARIIRYMQQGLLAGRNVTYFKPTSQRYYLFAIQPRHSSIIKSAVDEMLATSWGEHFCLLRD